MGGTAKKEPRRTASACLDGTGSRAGDEGRELACANGAFVFDEPAVPLKSSGRKLVFRGMWRAADSSDPVLAVAVAFRMVEGPLFFGRECAVATRCSDIGVGPALLAMGEGDFPDPEYGNQKMAFLIEEDAGCSLFDAIFNESVVPGEGCAGALHTIGTHERDVENRKILFDVAVELMNLHEADAYHRDLRAANICVRRYGPGCADIRATLVDFDVSTLALGSAQSVLEPDTVAAARDYAKSLFEKFPQAAGWSGSSSKPHVPTPLEMDSAYFAALRWELGTGRSIVEASPKELKGVQGGWPLFWYGKGGDFFARDLDLELDVQALGVSLLDVRPEGAKVSVRGIMEVGPDTISDPACLATARKAILRRGFMDAKDRLVLDVLCKRTMVDKADPLARKSFEGYKKTRRDQGKPIEYETFDEQPLDLRNSAIEQQLHIFRKARMLGYRVVESRSATGCDRVEGLDPFQIEYLAYVEHRRWVEERLAAGWKVGPIKLVEQKISPYLVPYDVLSEKMKEYDRRPCRDMVERLEEGGFDLVR